MSNEEALTWSIILALAFTALITLVAAGNVSLKSSSTLTEKQCVERCDNDVRR
jgi:hypothetical protein